MPFIDLQIDDPAPKRGDLVQSNVQHRGNGRERTWIVLRGRRLRRRTDDKVRYAVFMARWWEIEPELRMRLFRSAERNGGQRVIEFHRYPAKRRKSFEDHMVRELKVPK